MFTNDVDIDRARVYCLSMVATQTTQPAQLPSLLWIPIPNDHILVRWYHFDDLDVGHPRVTTLRYYVEPAYDNVEASVQVVEFAAPYMAQVDFEELCADVEAWALDRGDPMFLAMTVAEVRGCTHDDWSSLKSLPGLQWLDDEHTEALELANCKICHTTVSRKAVIS